jgi:hypothetical protein
VVADARIEDHTPALGDSWPCDNGAHDVACDLEHNADQQALRVELGQSVSGETCCLLSRISISINNRCDWASSTLDTWYAPCRDLSPAAFALRSQVAHAVRRFIVFSGIMCHGPDYWDLKSGVNWLRKFA